jgi:hypothetical protein
MKNKLLSSIIFVSLLTSHKAKAEDYQLPFSNADIPGTTAYFARSVFFDGVGNFFKDVFNAPAYGADFLPNNFFHMIELLNYGNQHGKDRAYVKTVIRLFSNKLKTSSYINAYTYCDLLPELTVLLEPHFTINSDCTVTSLKDIIYEIQYQSFKAQFPEFKASPETFLTKFSQQIEDAAELRKLTTVFLEVSLNKLIWSPEDQFNTWLSVKLIADQLSALYKRTIIPDLEDLNGLYITLLERYCMFLDVASSHLEIATIQKIKEDINAHQTPLLSLPEQEELLETKMQRLCTVLARTETKMRARAKGMVV